MLRASAAGFHAVAPDLLGYSRTRRWSAVYDTTIAPARDGPMISPDFERAPTEILNASAEELGIQFTY